MHEGTGREELLDLTFSSSYIRQKIKNWHVSGEISLSDHRHICFEIRADISKHTDVRIPGNTDWDLYKELLQDKAKDLNINSRCPDEIDRVNEELQGHIFSSFLESCPVRMYKSNRNVPWWNDRLTKMRKKARRLYNSRNKSSYDKASYKETLTCYNKAIRRAKAANWRGFCEEVTDTHSQSTRQGAYQWYWNSQAAGWIYYRG